MRVRAGACVAWFALSVVALGATDRASAADEPERATFPSADGRTTLVGYVFRPPRMPAARVPAVVQELLRYESPTQMVGRTAREDVALVGRRIRQGQLVYVVLGAANRDPAEFSEPDRLDLGRQPNRHLAFGGGVHSCPGQRLARIETEVAITRLLRRMPALRLGDKPPEWRREFGIRALESLPA